MRSKLALGVTFVLLLVQGVALARPAAAAAVEIWTGGGADANWSTPANWNTGVAPTTGDSLTFPASAARLSNNNDLPDGTVFSRIDINGVGYALSGNRVVVDRLGGVGAGGANYVGLPLTVNAGVETHHDSNAALTLQTVTLAGPVTVVSDGIITWNGVISGSGSVDVEGPGLSDFIANNTYTGSTTVGGELVVNGNQPASAVAVVGGLLSGSGTVGTLSAVGTPSAGPAGVTVDPGVGPLNAGNTIFDHDSTLLVDGGPSRPGLLGQLSVTGTVTLQNSPELVVTPASGFHAAGQTFTIIRNDATDAVSGTFAGLPEGAAFRAGNAFFRISYTGGDGNDVVLRTITPPAASVVTSPGAGGGPHVRSFGPTSLSLQAGDPARPTGANAAAGNLTGGLTDKVLVGSGVGVPATVRAYGADGSGGAVLAEPYPSTFTGGVNVAVGDGFFVTGAGPGGGPHVRVFDAAGAPVASFFAYDQNFTGGVLVAVGDLNGDGEPEIVTGPGPGGGPDIRVFSVDGTLLSHFFAYDSAFRGGASVATADVNGDGVDEIVTGAGPGGGPEVRVLSSAGTVLRHFFAYDVAFHGGVRVGSMPNFVAGHDDVLAGAGPGGGPHVREFMADGTPVNGFFAYDPGFTGGVKVAGAVLNAPPA